MSPSPRVLRVARTVHRVARLARLVPLVPLLHLAVLVADPASAGEPAVGPPGGAKDARRRVLEIRTTSGVRGGLAVHLGCGDGRLTAALGDGGGWVVLGLDRDPRRVAEARARIRSLGAYGAISVDRLRSTRLPFHDGAVNLLVVDDEGSVPAEELRRVVAPGGALCRWAEGRLECEPRLRPDRIDEWTHYLYDASNNAVSRDAAVGPPRRLQWVGGPRWSRHHDHMSSISALVAAGGRLIYIIDEGPTASIQLPPRWSLVARDAFSGVILWRRPIPRWHTHLWPLKSGPAHLPRRLVASADRVWVTLGIDAPLSELDAATGRTLRTYEGTRATEELVQADGVLYLVVGEPLVESKPYHPIHTVCWEETGRANREWAWERMARRLVAVRLRDGSVLWDEPAVVAPLTLAVGSGSVCCHDGEKVVSRDRETGKVAWESEPIASRFPVNTSYGATLVIHGDTILFSGGKRKMWGLDPKSGQVLWSVPQARSGHQSPEDMLVAGGLVWSGATAGGRDSGVFTGRDPRTGEVRVEFPPDVDTYWFHQRCYRSKATEKYLLPSRTGVEFVDFREEHWIPHHWFRGGCVYGILPANGLVYAPPHPCACYLEAKLSGFCALASEPDTRVPGVEAEGPRLEVHSEVAPESARTESASAAPPAASLVGAEWPTYRHDAARSGASSGAVPADVRPAWRVEIGGRLTAPVVAGGRVLVASIDAHTLRAIDAEDGTPKWSRTVGGRIDSPPTVDEGRAIFGSRDGWVHCVRVADGEPLWSFRAAPEDRRILAFEQLESAWPVSGSVLVQGGVVWCVAGRSAFLGGGLRVCRLDARTGALLSENVIRDEDPDGESGLQAKVRRLDMPVALPDVLSSDGRHVYMRSQRFDLEGRRVAVASPDQPSDQIGEGAHLFCPGGFLDDSWWHRSYWIYGQSFISGCNWWFRAGRFAPAGRILVFDDSTVYGFGRRPEYFVWTHVLEYHLFAARKAASAEAIERVVRANQRIEKDTRWAIFNREVTRSAPLADISAQRFRWSSHPPLWARAMVLAGGTLFVAGPPDAVDEDQVFRTPDAPEARRGVAEQDAALRGLRGGVLQAVSAADGSLLVEKRLDSMPVFDGMAAAYGRLYLAATDGRLICLAAD